MTKEVLAGVSSRKDAVINGALAAVVVLLGGAGTIFLIVQFAKWCWDWQG